MILTWKSCEYIQITDLLLGFEHITTEGIAGTFPSDVTEDPLIL